MLARVERGDEIIVARAGRPVARLVPGKGSRTRRFGSLSFEVPDGFDTSLDEVQLVFVGVTHLVAGDPGLGTVPMLGRVTAPRTVCPGR